MTRYSKSLLGGFALCLLALLPGAQPVAADTYVVTNDDPSGPGSLAAAVTAANANANADVITFNLNPATDPGPIVPSSQLLINNSVTIKGPGAANLALSGNGSICPIRTQVGTVVISGLRIIRGSSGAGAGLSNITNLTLVNCVFEYNSGNTGAAIYNQAGTLKMVNCLLRANTGATGGGGLWNEAAATVTNCTFTGNVVTGTGAAIYNRNFMQAVLTVNNCIFWGNFGPGGPIATTSPATATVNYSNVQGGWSGTGTNNQNSDPLFIRNVSRGPDNTWNGVADDLGDQHLQDNSPSLDAGDDTRVAADTADLNNNANTTEPVPYDLDGNERIANDAVDQGAFELPNAAPLTGDITGNVQVTVAQYLPNPATRTYQFYVRIKNLATAPLQGPIKLVLGGVPAAQCTNRAGLISGSPYVTIDPTGDVVAKGGSVLVQVRLQLPANPGGVLPGTLQVLAGP